MLPDFPLTAFTDHSTVKAKKIESNFLAFFIFSKFHGPMSQQSSAVNWGKALAL